MLAEANRRAAAPPDAREDAVLAAQAEAMDEELARELAAIEADLARRVAAHAAATAAIDELAAFAIDRLLAGLADPEAT